MGMGPIIWTCLALSLHQAAVQEEFFLDSRSIRLPLNKNLKKASELEALILLFSTDQGKVWQQADRRAPNVEHFDFRAPADGSYWFIIQEEDRTGRTTPKDPERVKPSQIIIVDTTRPQVKVTAERLPNGQIRARWTASDEHPDLRSLRVEYQTSAHPQDQWTPVPAAMVSEGNLNFDPGQAGKAGVVRVRVHMKDKAGNVGEDVSVLNAAVAAASGPVAPIEGSPISLIPAVRSESSVPPNQLMSQQVQRPVIDSVPAPLPPPLPPPTAEFNGPRSGPSPAHLTGMPIAANNDQPSPQIGSLSNAPPQSTGVKIVKENKVRLDFTVGKIGPSGLGNADVYVTRDRGANWVKMPGEVPITLPPNADLRGEVSGSVGVQLPAEGIIYGFIVAVKSKAGLAPPPPKGGEPPQALVELDTTRPDGRLFKPQLDPNQPNTLILGWETKDRNLGDKPITLEWAEQKDGPWTLIGEATLPNTGQYPWRLPERLPPRVYLRLTMRDLAENVSQALTDKPELIDLSVPQTRIVNVAPASR